MRLTSAAELWAGGMTFILRLFSPAVSQRPGEWLVPFGQEAKESLSFIEQLETLVSACHLRGDEALQALVIHSAASHSALFAAPALFVKL